MRDYLSNKYSAYEKTNLKVKPFNVSFVMEELLCSNGVARLHVKEVLGTQKELFNFDDFVRVIEVAIDLE